MSKLRKFLDTERKVILDYAALHGSGKAQRKYKLSSSLLHTWRKKFNMPTNVTVARQARGQPEVAKPSTDVRDAIIYLRHARDEIHKKVAAGALIDRTGLLTLLALDSLTGGGK